MSVVPSGNSILTEGTSPTSLSLVKVNFGNDSEEPSAKMLVIISNKNLKNKNKNFEKYYVEAILSLGNNSLPLNLPY